MDPGSEYQSSNALGHGAGIDTIIKPGNRWHQGITRQVFFFSASALRVGPAHKHLSQKNKGGSRPQALLCPRVV